MFPPAPPSAPIATCDANDPNHDAACRSLLRPSSGRLTLNCDLYGQTGEKSVPFGPLPLPHPGVCRFMAPPGVRSVSGYAPLMASGTENPGCWATSLIAEPGGIGSVLPRLSPKTLGIPPAPTPSLLAPGSVGGSPIRPCRASKRNREGSCGHHGDYQLL